MAAINSVSSARLPLPLPLPAFSPRAVLMYSAALGGEGAVALQVREAAPGEPLAPEERALAIACHDPDLLADLLHAAGAGAAADDIGGDGEVLSHLLGASSPEITLASDASDSLHLSDHDQDLSSTLSSRLSTSLSTKVSVSVAGLDRRPSLAAKKVRPKPASPNRQGPQQCQVCNKIFGNASALAKHKLTHSDERKYVCSVCSKAFKRQDHLNGHMLTHRNKKPYECKAEGCGKSYCDARSLRRHTENHHHRAAATAPAPAPTPPPQPDAAPHVPSGGSSWRAGAAAAGGGGAAADRERACPPLARGASPASPAHPASASHSDSSSSSERWSCGEGGSEASSPAPATPPAAPTPPIRVHRAPSRPPHRAKTFTITLQHGSQNKCGGGSSGGTVSLSYRPHDKPVECNLCHRKFKNIPALNGHMRLHGGYFKKESDNKKLDKKESTGPPLQTASVSVRALIEEKIISRRSAIITGSSTALVAPASTAQSVATLGLTETATVIHANQASFVAPAPPQLASIDTLPTSPVTATVIHSVSSLSPDIQFISPRPPTPSSVALSRESTLVELLKKGSKASVKRSASDPGHLSPGPDLTYRPELFGVSFHSDDGYFSPALQDDGFQFTGTADNLDELASLEDYATVAASIRDRSPVHYPSSGRLAAVLNSPLPEALVDFGAYHASSPPPYSGTPTSPSVAFTGAPESPGFVYGIGGAGTSPRLAFPTPPASHEERSPASVPPRASSPLSAAFFTATMSTQEELEEALEEVLPEECNSMEAYVLEDPSSRHVMLNSDDPLLSSKPRELHHRHRTPHRIFSWDSNSIQACLDSVNLGSLSSVRKRRGSPTAPHRSRLRRLHPMPHYTPAPMLSPSRSAQGLYNDISPDEVSIAPSMLSSPGEERAAPAPQINVGPHHQADIPEMRTDRIDLHRAPEQLLWDPGIDQQLDENEVRMFMELAMCAAMPVGGHSREFALQTLGECGGDVRAATLRLMAPRGPHTGGPPRWAPHEVEAFLQGLAHYDKDFYRIAQLIKTKDSKQCVQFYYFWKKVTKDYKSLFVRGWKSALLSGNQGSDTKAGCNESHVQCRTSVSYEAEEFPCKVCGKVFNKVKSRSAHMKSHRAADADSKRSKVEKPYEKVDAV